jgi:SAM-dependent methyltransferase
MDTGMIDNAMAPLIRALARNRFLPVPPSDLVQCGDGDFRAIGAEFLGHFIAHGGLRHDARVLEIGCGVGRMALPLTQYLSDDATYDGIDVDARAVAWAAATITPLYPNARFTHLDVAHPLYNPHGARAAGSVRLPYADSAFDFIALVSVFTHLDAEALARYAAECARLLAPGGRCFATAFLLNPPARAALRAAQGRLAFAPDDPAPVQYADPAAPLAAVAFDEDFFVEKFLRAGLRRLVPARYGHWSGRPAPVFQDICVFEPGAP